MSVSEVLSNGKETLLPDQKLTKPTNVTNSRWSTPQHEDHKAKGPADDGSNQTPASRTYRILLPTTIQIRRIIRHIMTYLVSRPTMILLNIFRENTEKREHAHAQFQHVEQTEEPQERRYRQVVNLNWVPLPKAPCSPDISQSCAINHQSQTVSPVCCGATPETVLVKTWVVCLSGRLTDLQCCVCLEASQSAS